MGEREVLILGAATTDSLVILDDSLGRHYARQLNITFTGTLGILLRAKQLGYVDTISPVLDQVDALRFRLDPATRTAVLKLANEAP